MYRGYIPRFDVEYKINFTNETEFQDHNSGLVFNPTIIYKQHMLRTTARRASATDLVFIENYYNNA